VELVASDISDAALSVARRGQYRPRSLRRMPAGVDPSRWISEHGGGLTLDERIRAVVQWRRLNLLDAESVRALATFDLILCRNLLIYFRDEVARKVVDGLARQLAPSGALLVGVSESLMRFGTILRCEEHGGVFVYRKASES
jgi:chemotaxis protein methyltransferase CheR